MNFEQLIQTCEQAHHYLQGTAISAVNRSLTIRNWLFGYYIVEYEQKGEDRAKYGTELLKKLADRLSCKNVKGLSDRSLRNCRQFYLVYPEIGPALSDYALPVSIWQTPSAKSEIGLKHADFKSVAPGILISELSFSHIIELAREDDLLKRTFYEVHAIQGSWSLKELQRQMGSLLYERTGLSTDKKGLIQDINEKAEPSTPEGIMRDPYVFEFVGLEPKEKFAESELEEALISHLQVFLLELGKGFCFEARQKRLTIDGEYYYVDLVFYHRILKCHVIIDNPPVGIVLCTDKKSSTVKYATGSLENQLFVSRYQVELPTVKELQEFIKRDIKMLGG